MTQFYEWDYDAHKIILWQRNGECNHCGECCKKAGAIQFEVSDTMMSDNTFPDGFNSQAGGDTTNGKGNWNEFQWHGQRRFFGNVRTLDKEVSPCSEWQDGRCAIHNADKPVICHQWPLSPRQIEPYPDCSYTFEKIEEYPLTEDKD
jgi:hypothetical protein